MKRLLKHICRIASIFLGLFFIKLSIWFESLYALLTLGWIGIVLIFCGIYDYVIAFLEWKEKIKREKEEQLRRERLKKLLEEEERRREEQRKRTAELINYFERTIKYPKITIETTGQILKRLGIKREKRKIAKPKKELVLKKVEKEKERISTLEPLIQELLTKKELFINRHLHYGRLRSKDIARALAKELKRKGIKYELKMDDYDAFIKIKGGGKCGAKNC